MSSQAAVKAEDFDFPSDEPTVVGPNESDIATTQHGEQMNAEAPGRRRFGNYHLWSTSDGPKNASYNIEDPRKTYARALSKAKSRHTARPTNILKSDWSLAKKLANTSRLGYREIKNDKQNKQPGEFWTAHNDEGDAAFFHDKMTEPLSDETMSSLVTELKIKLMAMINTKARAIFTSTQVHANHMTCTPETASTVHCALSDVDIPGSEDRRNQSSSRAHADEMTEKHGLVLSKSIDDVIAQFNNVIDVSALRAGLEQLASIHACLLASNKASLSRQLDSAIFGMKKGILWLEQMAE
ncbi:uncharacterized protein FTJAE_13058 [Fusarium tjaetaba]|uniref:Uncharacterized protein n=1 Tax=Fusarium tjaetaba TaxID=1567544 RepID=A0A8H5VBM5_9HYPO|nr:uncharacterized protein FTJAE_13058 [Fusarium tjaetaba]KAF5616115.1 hypothetical protein FTJAE_13058 [Fusarium tjaetaba]